MNYVRKLCLIIVATSLFASLQAQPDTLWTKTMGYTGNEYFTSIERTTDGGFILGGSTSSFFNDTSSYWLVRLDSDGDTVWSKVFRANEKYDNQNVLQTSDGGFAIAGDGDPWLIKTDANGIEEWQQASSTLSDNVTIYGFEQTADQGFIATGIVETDSGRNDLVVKTDNNGAVVWINSYGGEHDAAGLAVTETSDGGIAVAGAKKHTTSGGVNHGWLLKLSASGDSLWSVVYGDTADGYFKGLQETADGGFILVGLINPSPNDTSSSDDMYLVKTDSLGVHEWTQIFGGADNDEGMTVIQTIDLGYTFIGFGALETGGDPGAWVVHTDANGDILWTLVPGDPNYYFGLDLVELSDNEYLLAGGRIDWDLEEAFGWIARVGTPVVAIDPTPGTPIEFALRGNYPNPFNPGTTIRFDLPEATEMSLVIYDMLGREVVQLVRGRLASGYRQVVWNGRTNSGHEAPTGIYFARLTTATDTRAIKMLLLK
ncbi:T9SS type A sorting domain-containing protein [Candidatus Neomarinimicrobiota bacterium]